MEGSGPIRPARDIVGLPPDEYVAAMRERYRSGETPWDSGVPNSALTAALDAGELVGRTILEMGCGTGTNAIELARRGFSVTAIDLVDVAIARAREKARDAGVEIDFQVGDLKKLEPAQPFDCLLDIGVYHGIRRRGLDGFLSTLRRVSRPGTRWLCVAGHAREPLPEGPPVVSESDFRSELGHDFRILRATETHFELRPDFRPLAWSILLERR